MVIDWLPMNEWGVIWGITDQFRAEVIFDPKRASYRATLNTLHYVLIADLYMPTIQQCKGICNSICWALENMPHIEEGI